MPSPTVLGPAPRGGTSTWTAVVRCVRSVHPPFLPWPDTRPRTRPWPRCRGLGRSLWSSKPDRGRRPRPGKPGHFRRAPEPSHPDSVRPAPLGEPSLKVAHKDRSPEPRCRLQTRRTEPADLRTAWFPKPHKPRCGPRAFPAEPGFPSPASPAWAVGPWLARDPGPMRFPVARRPPGPVLRSLYRLVDVPLDVLGLLASARARKAKWNLFFLHFLPTPFSTDSAPTPRLFPKGVDKICG